MSIVPRSQLADVDDPHMHTLFGGWLSVDRPLDIMLVHALWYVKNGYRVLPLKRETNLAHPTLLGHGWHYTANFPGTRDPEQINSWWAADPLANIGIQVDGCICLDVDRKPNKPNGMESLFELTLEYEDVLPEVSAAIADSPSGGVHMWFRTDKTLKKRDAWLPSVDVGGVNSLVAVAPSHRPIRYHENGRLETRYVPYRWRSSPPLPLAQLPRAPSWLIADVLERHHTRGEREATTSRDGMRPSSTPPTSYFLERGFGSWMGRNDDCYRVACRLWYVWNDDVDRVMSVIYDIWLVTPGHDTFSWHEACGATKSARRWVAEKRNVG